MEQLWYTVGELLISGVLLVPGAIMNLFDHRWNDVSSDVSRSRMSPLHAAPWPPIGAYAFHKRPMKSCFVVSGWQEGQSLL